MSAASERPDSPGAPSSPPTTALVQTRDGATIAARCHGRQAAGTPVLILDGIGCAGWAFRRVIPQLTDARPVIVADYRGHGASPIPARPWQLGMPTLADDADRVLEALGVEQVVVVGFSMGFQVALELYRRHRRRVAALVSLAGPAGRCTATLFGNDLASHAIPLAQAATKYTGDFSARLWKKLLPSKISRSIGLGTQVNAELVHHGDFDFYLQQMAQMSPELFMEMLAEADRHTAKDVLPTIDVPALVIAGRSDRFIPMPTLRDVAFAIKNARWVVIEGATHALPAEVPDAIADHVRALCDDHGL